ncbi:MAG: sulfatase-like hydrolase/transferase, partial [Verrucomicrobiota bacterium]
AYNAPHSPLQALQEDLEAEGFDPGKGRMRTDDWGIAKREGDLAYGKAGTGNDARQTFKANVRALDRGIGRLMEAIEESGESENTLVIFSSDNGGIPGHGGSNASLRGNKFQTYEGGVRVPAAIRWPAKFESPMVNEDTLAYVDVWPTLAALVGKEGNVDGEDMMPRLEAKEASWDRTLYLRGGSVIRGEWKLVADAKDCDDPLECGKLFNLRDDPYETTDLAKSMPDKVKVLYDLVKEFEGLRGPAFSSKYETEEWPPKEWELAEEPD